MKRVVAWNDKPGNVGQKLTAEVEDNEEEVKRADTDDGIGFGDTGLPFKLVQSWILGKLW